MYSFRKWLFQWSPVITAGFYGIMFIGLGLFANILLDLTDSLESLARSIRISKKYEKKLNADIIQTNSRINENEVHLEAQSQRIDVLEQRIRHLLPHTKDQAIKGKNQGTVIMREYVLIKPKAAKNAKQPKKAN